MLQNAFQEGLSERAKDFFPFDGKSIEGLKYLGFVLKPNSYSFKDWMWLIKKIQERIEVWTNLWLSRRGRLTLLNYVLSSIHVY